MSYRIAIKRAVLAVSFVLLPLFVGGCSPIVMQDLDSLGRERHTFISPPKSYPKYRPAGYAYSDYYR